MIFLGAALTLFLGIIMWKRFKRKSWVIEEYAYNPVLNPEDIPLNLYMGWTPVAYFPFSMQYFPETLIKDSRLDEAEITRKRVFEYSTLAEYHEFMDRVMEARKKPEKAEEKVFTTPETVRPLNEWITLEHGGRPLWTKFFLIFVTVLGVAIFVRMIWAFLTFPY